MNKVILMGNLTKDPEVRYSQGAEPVAVTKFTLAVTRKFKRDNEPDTDFINCVAFSKLAEFAEKYLKKGLKVAVVGRLKITTTDDAQGQRRWYTDVILDEIDFAESRSAFEARMANAGQQRDYGNYSERPAPAQKPAPQPAPTAPSYGAEGFEAITQSIDDDDLPF